MEEQVLDDYLVKWRKRIEKQRRRMESLAPLSRDEAVQTMLLPHQSSALHWLLERERSNALPPFWKRSTKFYRNFLTARPPFWRRGRTVYRNLVTGQTTTQRPYPMRGGMFADEVGLGKTLTLISLILRDKGKGRRNLVICPGPEVSSWASEMRRHCVPGAITVSEYKRPGDRSDCDVTLITFGTLIDEPAGSLIWSTKWWRLIVDECDLIGEPTSPSCRAVTRLLRSRVWLVSGTPILRQTDMPVYLGLLGLYPFNDVTEFERVFTWPERGVWRMQTLTSFLCLRRLKDDVGLPKLTTWVVTVQLAREERELYDRVLETARTAATDLSDHSIRRSPILRRCYFGLQKICFLEDLCWPELLPIQNRLNGTGSDFEKVTLQELDKVGEEFTCQICTEKTPRERMTLPVCLHRFCRSCFFINRVIYGRPNCPSCRVDTEKDVFSLVPLIRERPGKILWIIDDLNKHKEVKCVVFSQFPNALIALTWYLEGEPLLLHESLTTEERTDVLSKFHSDGHNVLLAPMMPTSREKLDLTIASRVYLLDSRANPAEEERAISHIHHIGQQQEVTVMQIIAGNTLEENIQKLQEYYHRLLSLAFKGDEEGLEEEGLPNHEMYTFIPH